MIPLPTSKRLWIAAYWTDMGIEAEELAALVAAGVDDSPWEVQPLMTQGGRAGVAVNSIGDVVAFGNCDAVLKIYQIAREVYDYPYISEEALCQSL